MTSRWRRAGLAAGLALAGLLLAGGCATRRSERAVLDAWTQLGAEGAISLRAIVPAAAGCPAADVDGVPTPMLPRAPATAGAAAPNFAVATCELAVPAAARTLRLAGRSLPLPGAARRIVVVGDTGCRIKVPAVGRGDPVQDCSDPAAWPWPRLAAAAARTRPDLVIHVGDYHYREYCADPVRCRLVADKGLVVGYGWAGWDADFFTPAAPLLAAAPWVFARGNHENCDRAGEGWMRFLSPLSYQPCGAHPLKPAGRSRLDNNHTAPAYRVDLDDRLSLIVADNAGHEDYRPATATPDDVAIFAQLLAILAAPDTRQRWLVSHRPIWYDLLGPAAQPNAFQVVLGDGRADNLQLAFGGHEHAFETIDFAADADPAHYPSGRPAQVIVGGGGTQLEALDPESALYEGRDVGSRERSRPDGRRYDGIAAAGGLLLNRHSFLLLERDADGWRGTVLDADGQPITRCQLRDDKQFACDFPSRR